VSEAPARNHSHPSGHSIPSSRGFSIGRPPQLANQAGSYWRVGVALDDGQTYYVNIGLL